MFVCVPDFEKATVLLRKLCIFTWTTADVDRLIREVSHVTLYTNGFSSEWIYSRALLNDGDTF
jgi:hypothetical protein